MAGKGGGLEYAVVARGTVVLAECSMKEGNVGAIARRILERLPEGKDTTVSYSQDSYIFHVLLRSEITFLSVASADLGRRIPYAFLEEIQGRFSRAYGVEARTALAYAYNGDFSRVLKQQMEHFSSNPNSDTISKVREEISQVKNVMVQNIDKVLDRGERIELLVDKTDNLQGDAFKFRKASKALKRRMWLNNMRTLAALVGIVALIIYFIVAMACGWRVNQC